jgi:hypothetical protein
MQSKEKDALLVPFPGDLRDWFAGQALVAMGDRRWEGDDNETATQKHAAACYAVADALLSHRNKEEGE